MIKYLLEEKYYHIKLNLTFLIIFIGLNYIYFNFGKNKFNFQIESFLKENLKKAFLDNVVFVDEKPMIDSDNLIKEYSYLVYQKYGEAEITQIYIDDEYKKYVYSIKEIVTIDEVKYEVGYGIKEK